MILKTFKIVYINYNNHLQQILLITEM